MAIEKAFAIKAPPAAIYAALEHELATEWEHSGETFDVLRRERGKSLELRVTMAGVPCWLTYRLEPRADHTEVIATLVPFGWKYAFFRIITLGLRTADFEVALVEGLSNLKAAVEAEESPEPSL
jgi:hypothetical protein